MCMSIRSLNSGIHHKKVHCTEGVLYALQLLCKPSSITAQGFCLCATGRKAGLKGWHIWDAITAKYGPCRVDWLTTLAVQKSRNPMILQLLQLPRQTPADPVGCST